MCGITGWVDWSSDLRGEEPTLASMTATMSCRGPDEEGTWLSAHAALGHRRLAVLDLPGGRQPMTADLPWDGDPAVLTYSGEVYNHADLRAELRRRGHAFTTRSDTEVVLRSYLEWGVGCVHRLIGMYAFAVWDPMAEELVLVRDRLGVKPLYYAEQNGRLLFGSEPKAVLAHPSFCPVLDAEGIAELFAFFGSSTPGVGVYRGLREVRPGHVVRVRRTGVSTHRYWQLRARPHRDDHPTTVAAVRSLLTDAVTSQLEADVPLCTLVSGGLDSSALAALASRSNRLTTFSVDLGAAAGPADADRPDLDAPYVTELVRHLSTEHENVAVGNADLIASQTAATRARDLPCIGDLDSSLYRLFAAIAPRSTVALSGESADEVFAGYGWFHHEGAVRRPGFPWQQDDRGLANVLAPHVQDQVQPEDYVRTRYQEALDEVPRCAADDETDRRMREISYLGLTRFLPVLLDRKDRMSMGVGLEVRVPFTDHRLLEYTYNIPWSMKAPRGRPKGLLRDAVSDLLPRSIVDRPKAMYPTATDPDYDTVVRQAARRLVDGPSQAGPLLDRGKVHDLADGTSRRPPWMQRLALAYLTQLDQWLTDYRVRVDVAA